MMFRPMPASPKPMTTSATQNQAPLPVTPHVINAHGTKYKASMRTDLACKPQFPFLVS